MTAFRYVNLLRDFQNFGHLRTISFRSRNLECKFTSHFHLPKI